MSETYNGANDYDEESPYEKCPQCQQEAYDSKNDYCAACGYEESSSKVCGGCLEEAESDDWNFCPHCGDKYDVTN